MSFYNSACRVGGLGDVVFLPTGVEYKCDVFEFVMFVSIGVEFKGGRLIEMFWRSNS